MFEGSCRDIFRLLRVERGAALLEDPELVAPYVRAFCADEVLSRIHPRQVPVCSSSGRAKITECAMEVRVATVAERCAYAVALETSCVRRASWSFDVEKQRSAEHFVYHVLPPTCALRQLFEADTQSEEELGYCERCECAWRPYECHHCMDACKVAACTQCGEPVYLFPENTVKLCKWCQ